MRLIDADEFTKSVVKSGFGAEFINRVTALLIDEPTIKPKKGKWIRHENPRYSYDREQGNVDAGVHYTCSECNHISWTYNYCPNCGADMRGTKDEH